MGGVNYMLGYHCGITFAGLKAASLFWLKDEESSNINYYRTCFAKKKFRFMVIKRGQGKKLFYVFQHDKLEEILFNEDNRKFLYSIVYNYSNIGAALKQLKTRLQSEGEFPHEIGLFLGYPLEDVKGFMSDAKGGKNIGGLWKVYSMPDEKAKLFARYNDCTQSICSKLKGGVQIEQLFKVV